MTRLTQMEVLEIRLFSLSGRERYINIIEAVADRTFTPHVSLLRSLFCKSTAAFAIGLYLTTSLLLIDQYYSNDYFALKLVLFIQIFQTMGCNSTPHVKLQHILRF